MKPPPTDGRAPTELADLQPAASKSVADSGRFFADAETISPLSLPIVGPVNYLRHKRTRPIALFFAVDDGPVHVWKWGEAIEPLLAAIKTAPLFVSHGAFDRVCWNVHMVPLGLPPIPIERSEATWSAVKRRGSLAGSIRLLQR